MILFIIAIVLVLLSIGIATQIKNASPENRGGARLIAAAPTAVAVILLGFATIYTQGVGEARVIVNVDGTIAGEKVDPGWGIKAPWQSTVDFDLFSQPATYAGNSDNGAPSYSGGEIDGYEITTSVKGGAQANIDLNVIYSLEPDNISKLYKDYRSQERFTSQIVNQRILAIARDVPSAYTPIEFRGAKRGEAATTMLDRLNGELNGYGIEVTVVSIQDIRFSDSVEASITAVEEAQQREEQAEADLRATEVSAQAQVVEATAEAEANRLRAESLTPELIEANRVEALREAAKKGSLIVVPDGSSPLIQVPSN